MFQLLKYGMVSNEADKLADSVTTLETFLSKNLPVKSSMDPDQFLTACSSHPAIKSLFLHSLKKIIHGGQKKQGKDEIKDILTSKIPKTIICNILQFRQGSQESQIRETTNSPVLSIQ